MRLNLLFLGALAGVNAQPTALQGPANVAPNAAASTDQKMTAQITYFYKCKNSPGAQQIFSIDVSLNNRHFTFAKSQAIDGLVGPTSRIDGKDVLGAVGFYHQSCGDLVKGVRCSTYFAGSLKTSLQDGERHVRAFAVNDKITDGMSPVVIKTCHRSPSCPVVDPHADHCQITGMSTAG